MNRQREYVIESVTGKHERWKGGPGYFLCILKIDIFLLNFSKKSLFT